HDLRHLCENPPQVIDWDFEPVQPQATQSLAFCRKLKAEISKLPKSSCCVLAGGTENLGALFSELFDRTQDPGDSAPPRLLGPTAEQMSLLREPRNLASWCQDLEVGFPWTQCVAEKNDNFGGVRLPSSETRWLRKSVHSAGGLGVREVTPGETNWENGECSGGYLQEFVPGTAVGVTFCLTDRRRPQFLGATRALHAAEWPGPLPFVYRGSLGPIALSATMLEQLERLAEKIQQETGLRGWLPMDLIVAPDDRLWLLEINPRWTAGMEVLHRSGINPVAFHLDAFGVTPASPDHSLSRALDATTFTVDATTSETSPQRAAVKAIVYADRDYELTRSTIEKLQDLWSQYPDRFADIPSFEQVDALSGRLGVSRGQPICTVRAELPWNPLVAQAMRPTNDGDSRCKEVEATLLQSLHGARKEALSLLQ
ncbi:MAG: ATP-grasp domain-containing protein, partial [Planctomycetota bacterium]